MEYQFKEDPFHLSPLWTGMLDIYREFAAICDRHGLRYYVTDGNCIGVLRHGGFIPWDDDFDVSMPRPDYEKFKALCKTELPPYYRFINWENAPELNKIYGKIQDSRREQVESIEKEVGRTLSNGVFIDIFPVDGYTESRILAKAERFIFAVCRAVERFRREPFLGQTKSGKIKWLFGALFSPLLWSFETPSDFLAYYEKRAKRYPYGSTSITGRASLVNSVTLHYPLSSWGEPVYGEYNGITVPMPHDYDTYLRVEFPNYMSLPPVEKRHPTHSVDYHHPWWLGPTVI